MTKKTQKKLRKALLLISCAALLVCITVGVTVAYLTDVTEEIENVFTVGNIDIELTETTTNYKMVPGKTIAKDPKVTVKANSEDCYVFVKIDEDNELDKFISYTVDTAWTALPGVEGVYYLEQAATTTDVVYSVLEGDQVTVNTGVTKDDMDALQATPSPAPAPKLTFTAYACQKANGEDTFTAAQAWTIVNPPVEP